jgi:HD-like signal output (HDOD) protein
MKANRLDLLVSRLTNREMPIFAQSLKLIMGIADRRDSSLLEVAQGILQDATLTARVLRVANSSYYNSSLRRITTVSRAVVILGLDTVRNMCLSIALVETALKGKARTRLAREMAHAFHAAVQASKFAAFHNGSSGADEEVFIAALLYRLGHIAFWCYGGEQADRLAEAMRIPGQPLAKVEQEVLGFRLHQLTMRLSKEWHLSELLDLALGGTAPSDPRVRSIELGYALVQSMEHGWDSPQVLRTIQEVARFVKMDVEKVTEIIQANTDEAAKIAQSHGIGKFSTLIMPPAPSQERSNDRSFTLDDPGDLKLDFKEEKPFPEPDLTLQLNILRDLSNLQLEKQLDVSLLFSILLEGIYRGIGMDRVLFALLTPSRQELKVKHAVGWADQKKLLDYVLDVTRYENIFSYILKEQRPIWIKPNPIPELSRLLTGSVASLTQRSPFFVMPIVLKAQAIGVIYADRQPSGRDLDEDSFSSFCTFGNMAGLCLASLTN